MNTIRLTLTSLIASVLLLLAACSQAPAPQEEPMLSSQAVITVGTGSGCEAAGGSYTGIPSLTCVFNNYTLNAGDTLVFRGGPGLFQVIFNGLTNNGTISTDSSVGGVRISVGGTSVNNGTIDLSRSILSTSGTFSNEGSVNFIRGVFSNGATFTNHGTIALDCRSRFSNTGSYTGNPLETECPSVTLEQATGQADPTSDSPITFTVVFSKTVTGFDSSDVTLSGTAGAVSTTVTESAPNDGTTYTVSVSGMTNDGTVIASVAANVVTDLAGNGNTASTSTDNTVTYVAPVLDTTPPVITPTVVGALGMNDWYTSDVNISWSVTDEESTASNQMGCEDQSVSSDTTGVTFTCEATSSGGTNSQSVTIKRDATNPAIAFANRTAPNGAGWNNSNVTLNWTCSDATSGAVNESVSQTVSGEGEGQSSTGSCTDNAGNSATDTQTNINIDKTAPTLNPVVSPNPVLLNGSASVTSGASETLSGLASESCGSVDTNSVGSKSVTCSATDNAGNSASANASYQVIYHFTGFFSPVDNLPTLNQVKAGSAVPVKFSLGGNQGLSILASGSPVSQAMSCSSTAPVDDIEQTVTAGNSSLSYDATTNTYSYVWKTQKSWAGTCRQLTVTLVDGTQHQAHFKFK